MRVRPQPPELPNPRVTEPPNALVAMAALVVWGKWRESCSEALVVWLWEFARKRMGMPPLRTTRETRGRGAVETQVDQMVPQ
ncbi:hypothetical protein SAMD00023353_5200320 [Rosellinia necatrix]|uniref:Uncharacterized protein n=1 Tax=Rosellinia necatrix TaxID=77044 RepID=A0A1S8A9V3_ROSNE|nr:hypothetical protein SAMD00023353_5200320 [Rosellinia necatrix]